MDLKIGTRGSLLATTQAGHVRDWLVAAGYPAQLHIVTTDGDVNMAPVERIGVGVFTQRLREALTRGECDVAVHSFKDLPTAADERFRLVVPVREDNREALIARDGLSLAQLPQGAKVGTSAPRRISQLRSMRPDLQIVPLRGNIETRMAKVSSGELDAVVLAYAGLVRRGYQDAASEVFAPQVFIPAPAQGALAVEAKVGTAAAEALDVLVAADAMRAAHAERLVLRRLEAGCTAPVAACSTVDGDQITVTGAVFALDGSRRVVTSCTGALAQALEVGEQVAQDLFARGAAELLA